jgi:hypothetical protein
MSIPGSQFFQLVAHRSREIERAITESEGGVELKVQYGAQPKLGVEIKTATHLALLEAWDQGRCLDATVLENRTKESTVIFSGPCPTDQEVDDRIAALCQVLQVRVVFE